MRLIIQPDADQLAKWAANYVVSKINKANPTPNKDVQRVDKDAQRWFGVFRKCGHIQLR